MANSRKQRKAAAALNLDLFMPEDLTPPAPATFHTRIREEQQKMRTVRQDAPVVSLDLSPGELTNELPSVDELYRLFDRYNWMYFDGRLPRVKIEYSNRMLSAGAYYVREKLIKIGRKYHQVFPQDIVDTLKHEMIHIIHFRHDAAFKKEAKRIGASVKAQYHPSLRKPARYVYECPGCRMEYPRQKRVRMASCGKCSYRGRFDPRFKLRLKSSERSGAVG